MRQPQDPLSAIRWLPVYNTESTPIPPFGVMFSTGFDSDTGAFQVGQPTADSQTEVLINGPVSIPPLTAAQGHRTEPCTCLIETADGVPAQGDDYGTAAGTWKLRKGKTGFRVIGAGDDANTAEMTFFGTSFHDVTVPGGAYALPWKFVVADCATTGDFDLDTLTQGNTVDGQTIETGWLVLAGYQTAPIENGLYYVDSAGGVRPPFDTAAGGSPDGDATDSGANAGLASVLVLVNRGTANAGTLWRCDVTPADEIGVDTVTFTRIDPHGSIHLPVRVATATAGTLSTSFENGDTVDGIALAMGDRILLKDQAAAAENGIYTVNAGGSPSRALDANTWSKLTGTQVAVQEGTANADTVWLCSSNQGGTLGTTAVTWLRTYPPANDSLYIVHYPVRVATTAAVTLATALENGDTLDGIALATGDRVLVKDQAAAAENGIYRVKASGVPDRDADADSWTELAGTLVAVMQGTANAETVWLCTNDLGGTLGATSVTWARIDASVAVRKNSAGSTFTRRRLNLIEGSGVTLTVADDAANDEVDVTIAASGGGSYTDEEARDAIGTALTDSNTIDFSADDMANTLTGSVRVQMSITSDASGIKLVGDATGGGGLTKKYYGTAAIGTPGWQNAAADVGALTDNTGGTANTTLQNIGAAYSQAEVANNFADVAAQINAIRTALRNADLMA